MAGNLSINNHNRGSLFIAQNQTAMTQKLGQQLFTGNRLISAKEDISATITVNNLKRSISSGDTSLQVMQRIDGALKTSETNLSMIQGKLRDMQADAQKISNANEESKESFLATFNANIESIKSIMDTTEFDGIKVLKGGGAISLSEDKYNKVTGIDLKTADEINGADLKENSSLNDAQKAIGEAIDILVESNVLPKREVSRLKKQKSDVYSLNPKAGNDKIDAADKGAAPLALARKEIAAAQKLITDYKDKSAAAEQKLAEALPQADEARDAVTELIAEVKKLNHDAESVAKAEDIIKNGGAFAAADITPEERKALKQAMKSLDQGTGESMKVMLADGSFKEFTLTTLNLNFDTLDPQDKNEDAITALNGMMDAVNQQSALIGSSLSQLDSLRLRTENNIAAESELESSLQDIDYNQVSPEYSNAKIKAQVSNQIRSIEIKDRKDAIQQLLSAAAA